MTACNDILTCLLATLLFGACTGSGGDAIKTLSTVTPTPTQVETPQRSLQETGTAATAMPSPTPVPTPPTSAAPLAAMQIEDAFPSLSFRRMVAMAYPDDGTGRLFVVLQPGRVMVFDDRPDVESAVEFLDIQQRVSDRGNEEGLLSIAFDPKFKDNGHFYVYYSAASPRRSVVSRFTADDQGQADPSSERVIIEVAQPFSNHNGGQIVFGPDGYLYIGLGDGGSGGDPQGNGQELRTLLGSILRIDVRLPSGSDEYRIPPDNPFADRPGGARPEIWAYGLRNPWRFSFDRETENLWAGDVGQNRYEEIDLIKRGINYGWNTMEGFHCFGGEDCDQSGLKPPVMEYGREGGCSVAGGYVYRGSRLPGLYGAYLYGDFCSGKVWALRYDGNEVTEHMLIVPSGPMLSSFGEAPSGEIYLLSFDQSIYRLVPSK